MKFRVFTAVLAFVFCQASGQSGVSTQGSTFRSPTASMQWTIGESVVGTLRGSQLILTQGFDQREHLTAAVTSTTSSAEKIRLDVFPNPVSEQLTISMAEVAGDVHYRLLGADGKEILSGGVYAAHHNIDFSGYAAGTYILIATQSGQPLKSFKIIKK